MIRFFKIISLLEGVSLLAILFVSMPLKYYFENPEPNKIIGMAHGVLFLLYVVLAIMVKQELKWSIKTLAIVLVCSIIPFGTFWMDYKYLEPVLKADK